MQRFCLLLELFSRSNREAIDLPRAERVVMLTFCVRIGACCASGHARYLARANPKISLPFFAAPPHTPPPKGERRKETFGLRRRFSLQKLRKVIIFPNSTFSDFPPPRGVSYTERVVYLTFAHNTPAPPHSSLASLARAAAVLPCVSLVASFGFVVFKVVCADAQAKLYVLVQPSQYAHISASRTAPKRKGTQRDRVRGCLLRLPEREE